MTFDPREVIAAKRDGHALSSEQIETFIARYAAGDVPDEQAASLLMAVVLRGLERPELVAWTRAMLESGARLELDSGGRPKVDKHSTGGIGDKVSLVLAPALAACGACVPMISGRGLGHTGGTLDKLEAIPGFRTQLELGELQACLDAAGYFVAAQTDELVPADKRLYALRDTTATVESIPLIASSILSKKLAENLDALVLDVKFGSGAFLPELERGRELARTMTELASGFGLATSALLTSMERPLGRAVGHALEVRESIDALRGGGPADLRELTRRLGAELLVHTGLAPDLGAGSARLAASLDDGSALEAFREGVQAQGGDPRVVDRTDDAFERVSVHVVEADRDGYLAFADLRAIGRAALELGGGRLRRDDAIDMAVGLVFSSGWNTHLARGAPLVEVHHRSGSGLDAALAELARGVHLAEVPEGGPLVLD